jgi:hypothetical protein
MSIQLSPQNQQYLENFVADGMYPSQAAALREKNEHIPFVPPEHMELVEEALESSAIEGLIPMTAEDWANLRQLAHDMANKSGRNSA